jgi:hypothetical protein
MVALRLFSLILVTAIALPAAANVFPYETPLSASGNNVTDVTFRACDSSGDANDTCFDQTGVPCAADEICDLAVVPAGRCTAGGAAANLWPLGSGSCVSDSRVACLADAPNDTATVGSHASAMCSGLASDLCDMSTNDNSKSCASDDTVCGTDLKFSVCSDGDPLRNIGGYGTALCSTVVVFGSQTATNCGEKAGTGFPDTPLFNIENPPTKNAPQRNPGTIDTASIGAGAIITNRTTSAQAITAPDTFGVVRSRSIGKSYYSDWFYTDKTVNGAAFNSVLTTQPCDLPALWVPGSPVAGECDAGGGGGAAGSFCRADSTCDGLAAGSVCINLEYCHSASQAIDSYSLFWTRDLPAPGGSPTCPPDCRLNFDHDTFETEELLAIGGIDRNAAIQATLESGEGAFAGEGDFMGVASLTSATFLFNLKDERCHIGGSPGAAPGFTGLDDDGTPCVPNGTTCRACTEYVDYDNQNLPELDLTRYARLSGRQVGLPTDVLTPLFVVGTSGSAATEFRDNNSTGANDSQDLGLITGGGPGVNLFTGRTGFVANEALPFFPGLTSGPAPIGPIAAANPGSGTGIRGENRGPGPNGVPGCFNDNAPGGTACTPTNYGSDDVQTTSAGAATLSRFKARDATATAVAYFSTPALGMDGINLIYGYSSPNPPTWNSAANFTLRDLDFVLGADAIDVIVKVNTTSCPIQEVGVDGNGKGIRDLLCADAPADPCAGAGGDADGDGICQNVDNCPEYATANTADTNTDGIGDECQCGDADNNGTINLDDIFRVNDIIFGFPYNDLADTDNNGVANLDDIFGVNDAIFEVPGTEPECVRYTNHPGY